MLSASCSIETPAFTRRTLDWLKTSLLNGISREGLSLIFSTAFAMSDSPRRVAERLSLDLQPVMSIRPSSRSLTRRGGGRMRERGDASRGLLIARGARVGCLRQEAEQEIGSLRSRARGAYDGTVILPQ